MNQARKFAILLFIQLNCLSSNAQEDPAPDCILHNPNFKLELFAGKLTVYKSAYKSGYGGWASSTLEGDVKTKPPAGNPKSDDEYLEAKAANDAINEEKCIYSAFNLNDNNPATAWVEGMEGDGIGEIVLAPLDDPKRPVSIWSGYGKSVSLFKANNRVAKARVYLLETQCFGSSQTMDYYFGLSVIAKREVTLKDFNGYQDLPLPDFSKFQKQKTCEEGMFVDEPNFFLALEILSVYKGTKYSDTCISEIKNK